MNNVIFASLVPRAFEAQTVAVEFILADSSTAVSFAGNKKIAGISRRVASAHRAFGTSNFFVSNKVLR